MLPRTVLVLIDKLLTAVSVAAPANKRPVLTALALIVLNDARLPVIVIALIELAVSILAKVVPELKEFVFSELMVKVSTVIAPVDTRFV